MRLEEENEEEDVGEEAQMWNSDEEEMNEIDMDVVEEVNELLAKSEKRQAEHDNDADVVDTFEVFAKMMQHKEEL